MYLYEHEQLHIQISQKKHNILKISVVTIYDHKNTNTLNNQIIAWKNALIIINLIYCTLLHLWLCKKQIYAGLLDKNRNKNSRKLVICMGT